MSSKMDRDKKQKPMINIQDKPSSSMDKTGKSNKLDTVFSGTGKSTKLSVMQDPKGRSTGSRLAIDLKGVRESNR